MGLVFMALYAVMMLAILAGYWKLFEKAGEPGWAALIPFYNLYVVLRIAGLGIVYFFLMFVPLINIPVMLMATFRFVRAFGGGLVAALGLIFLPFVFAPMMGFSDAQYQKP